MRGARVGAASWGGNNSVIAILSIGDEGLLERCRRDAGRYSGGGI